MTDKISPMNLTRLFLVDEHFFLMKIPSRLKAENCLMMAIIDRYILCIQKETTLRPKILKSGFIFGVMRP
jgi:hypothetical protein